MTVHLDTSFLIKAMRKGLTEDLSLRAWLEDGTELGMSSIAWTEFLCGPLAPNDIELARRIVAEPEPFLAGDAVVASRLFNESGRRRGSLVDCMVAATAIRLQAVLATSNPADFRRFESAGLSLA